MSNPFVYEFLYRGALDASAWHVVLAETADVMGQPTLVTSPPLTPDQAQAQGFALEAVLAGINTQTLAELAAARERISTLEAQLDAKEPS